MAQPTGADVFGEFAVGAMVVAQPLDHGPRFAQAGEAGKALRYRSERAMRSIGQQLPIGQVQHALQQIVFVMVVVRHAAMVHRLAGWPARNCVQECQPGAGFTWPAPGLGTPTARRAT